MPKYIDKTLHSLKVIDRTAHIFIDGSSDKYVGNCQNVETHKLSKAETELQNYRNKFARAGYNYCRCLGFDISKDALVLEDDVVVHGDIVKRLDETLQMIPDKKFLLAVFHEWSWAMQPTTNIVQMFIPVVTEVHIENDMPAMSVLPWAGTNCVYYSSALLQSGLIEYVKEESAKQDNIIYDHLVGMFCMYNNVPIYLMNPKGANDIGVVSCLQFKPEMYY